jgi:hypothetical protein
VNASPATDVDQVLAGALALLDKKPGASVADLAAVVVPPPAVQPVPQAAPFPAIPTPIAMTDEARVALRLLPKAFGSLSLTTRRSLSAAELQTLMAESALLAQIASVLSPRMEEIKEIVRVHMDVDAEERGLAHPVDTIDSVDAVAATTRDHNGHYLLAAPKQPHQVPVPSAGLAWSQQYTSGSATPSLAQLEAALENGEITRAEYLACTREKRVLDEDNLKALINRKPGRGLAILRRITVRSAPNSSLNLRKIQ